MDGLHLCLHGWRIKILSVNHPWRTVYDLGCGKNAFTDETFDDGIAHLFQ
jgi:hypothetical protein